jgi:hypothetical protein
MSSERMHWNIRIFSNSEDRSDVLPLRLKDATLNCSKLLDTDGHPDRKISSSGRMLLTDERPDGIPCRPDG